MDSRAGSRPRARRRSLSSSRFVRRRMHAVGDGRAVMGDECDREVRAEHVSELPQSSGCRAGDHDLRIGRTGSSAAGLERVGRCRDANDAVVDANEQAEFDLPFDGVLGVAVVDQLRRGDHAVASSRCDGPVRRTSRSSSASSCVVTEMGARGDRGGVSPPAEPTGARARPPRQRPHLAERVNKMAASVRHLFTRWE